MVKNITDFKFFIVLVFVFSPLFSFGVTQKEMEEARTIAAKAYLRYANDGSGYLDDLNPKTIADLEASLKTKEKENIVAFKAIPVPSDYQSWDKEKLVEYWAVTAFQNKGLLEKGRGGRLRARTQINKMTLSVPQPVSSNTQTSSSSSPTATPSDSLAINQPAELDSLKKAEQEILAQENAEDQEINVSKATNYTWVYIMVLAILVAIVVALVVYAANVFKKNGSETRGRHEEEDSNDETVEHLESMLSDKDVEISMLKKKIENLTKQNADLTSRLESLSLDLAALSGAAKTADQIAKSSQNIEPSAPQKKPLRSIFLGRANVRGIFIRADRSLNVGHSVFVLETSDGFSGTFKVADSPAAWSLALSNPREYLETACTGHNLEDTADASKIVTESSGTAVFEGGCWRVIRKAKIRYEN